MSLDATGIWSEIAPESLRPRFLALQKALEKGDKPELAQKGTFVTCDDATLFPETFAKTKLTSARIRLAPSFRQAAGELAEERSVATMTHKACDAIDLIGKKWWPRDMLSEGILSSVAHGERSLDLQGAVFMIGASTAAFSAVSALSRAGLREFLVVDSNAIQASSLATDLRRSFFRAKFESLESKRATQLPGAYSVVVNLLGSASAALFGELAYLNFMKPNGIWIEIEPGPLESPLLLEAVSAGAHIEPGHRVLARADAAWAAGSLDAKIDVESHSLALAGT